MPGSARFIKSRISAVCLYSSDRPQRSSYKSKRAREDKAACPIYIRAVYTAGGVLRITVKDKGAGIADVALARTPLYTTDAEGERSGMGFTVMESFTDKLRVRSAPGKGTVVTMEKHIGKVNRA